MPIQSPKSSGKLVGALKGTTKGLQASTDVTGKAMQGMMAATAIVKDVVSASITALETVNKMGTGLSVSLKTMSETFFSTFKKADDLEKQALNVGRTRMGIEKQLGSSIENLPGSIADNMGDAIGIFSMGLRGNQESMNRLSNLQRLTGKNGLATVRALVDNSRKMGISQDGTDRLAESMMSLQIKFGTSMDTMVGAIGSMTDSFSAYSVMSGDLPAKLAETTGGLVGQFGAQSSEAITDLMKAVTASDATSLQFQDRLRAMGSDVAAAMDTLSRGEGSLDQNVAAIETMQAAMQQSIGATGLTGENTDVGVQRQAGMAGEIFGQLGGALQRASAAMEAGADQQEGLGTEVASYAETVGTMQETIMKPVMQLALQYFDTIKENLMFFGELLTEEIIEPVAAMFGGLFAGNDPGVLKETIQEALRVLKSTFMSLLDILQKTFNFDLFNSQATSAMDGLVGVIEMIIGIGARVMQVVTWIGWMFFKLAEILFAVIDAVMGPLLQALDFFGIDLGLNTAWEAMGAGIDKMEDMFDGMEEGFGNMADNFGAAGALDGGLVGVQTDTRGTSMTEQNADLAASMLRLIGTAESTQRDMEREDIRAMQRAIEHGSAAQVEMLARMFEGIDTSKDQGEETNVLLSTLTQSMRDRARSGGTVPEDYR
jgi:hypothetical protein